MLNFDECRVTDSKYYKSGIFLEGMGHKKARPAVAGRVSATLVAVVFIGDFSRRRVCRRLYSPLCLSATLVTVVFVGDFTHCCVFRRLKSPLCLSATEVAVVFIGD
ncbi:MAG: hypothetical protein ACOYNO_06235 [Saprospiraceae bacterium]